MKYSILILQLILCFTVHETYAQSSKIFGKVSRADNGNSIPGVNISPVGSNKQVITDIHGIYEIEIDIPTTELLFSFVGMHPQIIEIKNKDLVNVRLEPILANEEQSMGRLNRMLNTKIVSATKTAENFLTAPALMFVVDDEQFQERGYHNLFDLLMDIPGFDWETCNGGWVGEYSRLRGTKSLREVLLLVDGVVQNTINESESGRFSMFDLTTIKRVEIITGPASALYGANALLGVINLITKKPNEFSPIYVSTAYTSNISNDAFAFNKVNVNLGSGKQFRNGFGYLANINIVRSDDMGVDYYDPDQLFEKGAKHILYGDTLSIPDNGFKNNKEDISYTLRLTKDNKFTFGIDFSDNNQGIGSFVHAARYFTNSDTIPYRWHTRRFSAFVSNEFNITPTLTITPKLYHRKDQVANNTGFAYTIPRTEVNNFPVAPGVFRSYKQKTFRTGVDLVMAYQPIEKINLLGGINYEESQATNEESRFAYTMSSDNNILFNQGEAYNDTAMTTFPYGKNQPIYYVQFFSVYLQGVYNINSSFKILAGGRFDKEKNVDEVLNPRFGLVYNKKKLFFKDDVFVGKMLYGKSFRSLPIYQKIDFVTAKILKNVFPETASTYESSLSYIPNKLFRFELSGWYNDMQNLLLDATYGVSSKIMENGQPISPAIDAYTYGMQAMIDFSMDKFMMNISYCYIDGKNHDVYYDLKPDTLGINKSNTYETLHEELINIAKHKANLSFTYYHNDKLTVNFRTKWVGERTVDPENRAYGIDSNYEYFATDGSIVQLPKGNGTMEGYTLFDLSLQSKLGNTGLKATFSISNLLNTNYLEPSRRAAEYVPYYHPQPGRRFSLNLSYQLQ